MKSPRLLPIAVLALRIIAALVGAALVVAYILKAVIDGLGESDQSLLFWYLPVLFLGLGSAAVGLVAGIWAMHRFYKNSKRCI